MKIDTLVLLMERSRAFIAQSLIVAGRKAMEPVAFMQEWCNIPGACGHQLAPRGRRRRPGGADSGGDRCG